MGRGRSVVRESSSSTRKSRPTERPSGVRLQRIPRIDTSTVLRTSRFSWQLFAIFVVAFVTRLIYIFQIRRSPFFDVLIGDAQRYDLWGSEIAAGDWIGQNVFYQAPLYPYFLGLIYTVAGHDLLIARVTQALLGAATCVFLALTARRLVSERAGLIAGLGLAFYAPAIFFTGLLQKSTLDLFFIALLLLLITGLGDPPSTRSRWMWLGMVLAGWR